MNINNAKGSNLRVHFKNTRETCHAIKVGLIACVLHATTALTLIYIKGMMLKKAQAYLQHVVEHTRRLLPSVASAVVSAAHPRFASL